MKTMEQIRIKRTVYKLMDDNYKYHVTRTVGHNVHYLYTTKSLEEAMKYFREIPLGNNN